MSIAQHRTGADGARRLDELRVLVIDDDSDGRELTGFALRQHGATVVLMANVEDALKTLETFRADVVVSDIQMPDLNGKDFIRALRSSRHSSIPAIALSGNANEAQIRDTLERGFDVYLVKPVDVATMVNAVFDTARIRREMLSS